MNVTFFQTYHDRLQLLQLREKDEFYKKFIKEFDLNIISLHNVAPSVKNYISNSLLYQNFLILNFNNITYTECIKKLKDTLTQLKTKKLFFYQDDTFSHEINENNYNDLLKYIFKENFDMFNLSYKIDHLKSESGNNWNEQHKNIIFKTDNISIYDTNTFDFKHSKLWSMDDSCYVMNFDFFDIIYDSNYLNNFTDIWSAEYYLKCKFNDYNLNRYISNISFFKNYNIMGPNKSEKNIEEIKTLFKDE